MNTNYNEVLEELRAFKPSYEAQLQKLEALSLPDGLPLRDFFGDLRQICLQGKAFGELINRDPELKSVSLKELQEMNREFFSAVEPEQGYASCIANPDQAVKLYGKEMGGLCAAIYTQFRMARQHYLSQNYLQLDEQLRLWFRLYELAGEGNTDYEAWKREYRGLHLDHLRLKSLLNTLQRLSPDHGYYRDIIMTADLDDPRYLYRYGSHVSQYDLEMAQFLSAYPQEELFAIAAYVVQCWVDGFTRAKKDYRKKSCANVIIPCGMERLGRMLIVELERIGMRPVVHQPRSKGINRQYSYDHRFDNALILDREFVDESLKLAEEILEELKELLGGQAGPAVVELFGEEPFSPVAKTTALQLSPDQQLLWRELTARNAQLMYRYYRRDEASFTIIAFPSPEIGERFPQIFADTLKINLLDSKHYATIQQKIIDVLDTAEYVQVKGKAGNDTEIRVRMHPLSDPATQTNFENCVADVNIPVGEVFTSPVLEGTTGTLHVEDIYLGGLRYYNLRIDFEDGWVKDYSCTNFEDPADGRKYIHENLLLPHDSLPIGEFAIGTNTLAYQIARKYDILALLPILIIEKMGPHFAIGDTCFSHEEEAPHPSFMNGKEMIAVENEKSATRKEDPVNAYTNKHMDITLPYEMLASITAIGKDGTCMDIIRDGRFVVPGTEELNIPLDEGW